MIDTIGPMKDSILTHVAYHELKHLFLLRMAFHGSFWFVHEVKHESIFRARQKNAWKMIAWKSISGETNSDLIETKFKRSLWSSFIIFETF